VNPNSIDPLDDPSSHAFKKALKRLQKFARIPVTGDFDEETVKLLETSRCGMKDPVPPDSRKKRSSSVGDFTLHSSYWLKTVRRKTLA